MSNVLVSKIKLNNVIYEIADKNCEALIVALTERVNNLSTGGITVESDPVYLADKPNIALKSEIPTKLSQLEQDIQVGGIAEETDPVYLADKPNIALKSEIPSVPTWALASSKPTYTWSEIQEKPTIPSIEGLATEQYVTEQLASILSRLEALETYKENNPSVTGDTLEFE